VSGHVAGWTAPAPPDAELPQRLVALVEAALADLVLGDGRGEARFGEALAYPLRAGGKRLRPVLCLATAEALGVPVDEALPVACALELVHTFSLVHDDLPALDDDALRRGVPTTHVVYGEAVAILVGDALLNGAYLHVLERLDCPAPRRAAVLGALARGVHRMIEGQTLDLQPPAAPDEAWLAEMCALKTGSLIEASVETALALAVPAADVVDAYRAFARALGAGFQIVDDVLDATGTDAVLGKTAGSDAAHGKRTWVTVLGLERARERAAVAEARCLALADALPGRPQALRAIAARVFARDR
jgi:geranylgeranyl pyrophosphate synthase